VSGRRRRLATTRRADPDLQMHIRQHEHSADLGNEGDYRNSSKHRHIPPTNGDRVPFAKELCRRAEELDEAIPSSLAVSVEGWKYKSCRRCCRGFDQKRQVCQNRSNPVFSEGRHPIAGVPAADAPSSSTTPSGMVRGSGCGSTAGRAAPKPVV
jgi:hypothetical protein